MTSVALSGQQKPGGRCRGKKHAASKQKKTKKTINLLQCTQCEEATAAVPGTGINYS